jgi:DNA-binding MarR family transcriptional regulator
MAPTQEQDTDAAAPLSTWMETLIGFVQSDRPDLTNRQMAILLSVYLTPGPHTVRGLAGKLKVSKPVVTRALNTLGAYGYVRRRKDESDLRNVLVERTSLGQMFVEEFADLISSATTNARRRESVLRLPSGF